MCSIHSLLPPGSTKALIAHLRRCEDDRTTFTVDGNIIRIRMLLSSDTLTYGWHNMLVVVEEGQLRITFPDGESRVIAHSAGYYTLRLWASDNTTPFTSARAVFEALCAFCIQASDERLCA
jgi:hypothetical protein